MKKIGKNNRRTVARIMALLLAGGVFLSGYTLTGMAASPAQAQETPQTEAALPEKGNPAAAPAVNAPAEAAGAENEAAELPANPEGTGETASAEVVDVTKFSITMMIAELNNILAHPEDYEGKCIKTVGQFTVLDYNERQILGCYVGDPAGCCGVTMEFVTTEDYTYPEDFPAPASIIFVKGIFRTYEEDGVTYCRLENAEISTTNIE